jgi:hypothetical protein
MEEDGDAGGYAGYGRGAILQRQRRPAASELQYAEERPAVVLCGVTCTHALVCGKEM